MARTNKSLDTLARGHMETAIETLADIMINPMSEAKDRIKAADSILDRGYGKPVNAVISLPMTQRQARQLAGMSDEDLIQIINEPLPRLADLRAAAAPVAIDVEFEDRVATQDDPLLQ